MKKFVLAVLIIFNFSNAIHAQDFAAVDFQLPSYFTLSTEQTLSLTQMAYDSQYPQSSGGKLGYALLNVFFGLGSWVAKDWGFAVLLTIWQGLGAAGVFGFGWDDIEAGSFFDGFDVRMNQSVTGLLTGAVVGFFVGLYAGGFEGLLWGTLACGLIGSIVGFCVPPKDYEFESSKIGWAVFSLGVWTAGIIFGFVPPFISPSESKTEKTAKLNDIRNWDFCAAPSGNGRVMGRIGFTAHL